MIDDANNVPAGAVLKADLCIVGAGPAGISLALALMDSGLDVLLLESGADRPDPNAQRLYEGTVTDARMHSPPDRYRVRQFGGSSTLWGGRSMPLDPIDFEQRDYIPHSGWPIGMQDLLPYYPRANLLCEAGEFSYTAETAFERPIRPMIAGLDSDTFTSNTLERFSCPTDFGQRYRRRLQDGSVRLLQNANLCGLPSQPDGRIRNAAVRTLSGKAFSIEARAFVLAAGGLENARLLLASPGPSGAGIGNAHDVVGRFYMCHIAGTIGTMDLSGAASVWHGYEVSDEGVYCRRRLALSPQAQHRLRAGNFIARLHHPHIPDPGHGIGILSLLYLARPFIPYEYSKRLSDKAGEAPASRTAHLANVLRDSPATARFLWHWLTQRTLAARKFPSVIVHPRNRRYSLDFHAEQIPNPDSRVTLGRDADALGMRRLVVDWRYTAQDVATVSAALQALADTISGSGLGRFEYDPAGIEEQITRYGAYGGHHIGTARMGTDPRSSVVDADCRVHEAPNLYVAGSAVFPTSSQANPTLTIVALSLRLADHLKTRLSHED
ncbi:capsular polysaccharide biosynthesis oxidoreductase [Bordetella ansorpii]|uniref:Capsular polysaccharide biosynthesis oxidoreductase n=1 Tax=Bordetella ansorpii TaxID=288768 RepID=A0A157S8N2_9BORD|nr:capsular polysaccharide biosynthesis oxidoreductase [Bordetella ansorpii]